MSTFEKLGLVVVYIQNYITFISHTPRITLSHFAYDDVNEPISYYQDSLLHDYKYFLLMQLIFRRYM